MPNKKKKYNSRFPPARIKKIMQTDEDVGKVAAAVPVIISRALELFIESLIVKASQTTQIRHAKTLTTAHIKKTIEAEKKFDFLRDLVVNIADHQTEEDCDGGNGPVSHPNETSKKYGRVVGNRGPRKRKDSATSLASSENTRRSKQQQHQHEEDEEEEDNNSEETEDADSDEDEDLDQNQTEEEETATTSSCLRGDDEESPVPSSNGFPPPTTKTTSVPTGYHSFGQPSSQFKIPTLYTTTSLSRMLLPPGHTLGQQEDDDYDT